jgi:hypothetical protein
MQFLSPLNVSAANARIAKEVVVLLLSRIESTLQINEKATKTEKERRNSPLTRGKPTAAA